MIPCADPRSQYLSHRRDIDAAIARVLEGGRYVLGQEVSGFEREFARYLGVGGTVGVSSGTEALRLALVACGVRPGDEVVTVSHTAVATVAAVEAAGAVPVLVDVEPDTFTMDPQRLEEAVTPRTRAVVPVHLYGQPADMDPILDTAERHGLRVVEDCAQAHGARYHGRRVGSLGDAGCFSFYPTKNLGALGDGGAVSTNDGTVERDLRLLREYGWAERYVSRVPGWNARLDELQAAVLRVKLRSLDADNARRATVAATYGRGLTGVPDLTLPRTRDGCDPVHHLYVVRSPERDALARRLRDQGVATMVHYPVPVHQQPAYAGRVRCVGSMAETERAAREVLSLPMYPELPDSDALRVVGAIQAVPA